MKTLALGTPIANGDLPDADVLWAKLQAVADLVNVTKFDIDNLNGASPAFLALTNGSGVPAWQALSGDATIASNGALTIANGAITDAKIATGTIDAGKFATVYGVGSQTDATYALPADGSFHVIPGAESGVLPEGVYLVYGQAYFEYMAAAGSKAHLRIAHNHTVTLTESSSPEHGDLSLSVANIVGLAANDTLQLFGAVTTGSGGQTDNANGQTQLFWLRIA